MRVLSFNWTTDGQKKFSRIFMFLDEATDGRMYLV